jgi:hypothetical protein
MLGAALLQGAGDAGCFFSRPAFVGVGEGEADESTADTRHCGGTPARWRRTLRSRNGWPRRSRSGRVCRSG